MQKRTLGGGQVVPRKKFRVWSLDSSDGGSLDSSAGSMVMQPDATDPPMSSMGVISSGSQTLDSPISTGSHTLDPSLSEMGVGLTGSQTLSTGSQTLGTRRCQQCTMPFFCTAPCPNAPHVPPQPPQPQQLQQGYSGPPLGAPEPPQPMRAPVATTALRTIHFSSSSQDSPQDTQLHFSGQSTWREVAAWRAVAVTCC